MNDKDLVLNDGSTPLTATGNGTSFDIGSTINALTVEVIVSAKSGTSPSFTTKAYFTVGGRDTKFG